MLKPQVISESAKPDDKSAMQHIACLLSPSALQANANDNITAIEVYCKGMTTKSADENDAGSKSIGIGDSEENVHYDNNKARDDFIDNTTENTSVGQKTPTNYICFI